MGNTKLCDCKSPIPSETLMLCKEPIHRTKMIDVFNWIKQKAMSDEGLTVECNGDQLIFIKGRK